MGYKNSQLQSLDVHRGVGWQGIGALKLAIKHALYKSPKKPSIFQSPNYRALPHLPMFTDENDGFVFILVRFSFNLDE